MSGPRRRRSVHRALLGPLLFMEALYVSIVVPLLPDFEATLHATQAGLGLLVGAYSAGLVVAGSLMIPLASRFSIRRLLVVGCGLLASASAPFGFADTLGPLVAMRFLQGLGGALIFAGAIAWAIKTSPTGQGETVGRLWRWALAGTIAGPLAGAIGSAVGLGPCFLALSVFELLLARSVLRQRDPQPAARTKPLRWRQLAGLGRGLALMLVPAALVGTLEVVLPIKVADYGGGAVTIGVLFMTAATAEASLAPTAGDMGDRLGKGTPLAIGFTISAGVMLAMYWASATPVLAVLLIGAGVGAALTLIPTAAGVSEAAVHTDVDLLVAWSLINVVTSAAVFAGSAGAGTIADLAAIETPLLICAGLSGVTALTIIGKGLRRPTASA